MLKKIISIQNVGRFSSLTAESGNQGEFAKVNVIYARNGDGKSTLCDLFRSLTQNDPAYVVGRKRFGSGAASKVEVLLGGSPNCKAEFSPQGWTTKPQGVLPKIMIYDERFVLENVLVGHQVETAQRRSLFGLVIGAQAIALEDRVAKAGEAQKTATTEHATAEVNVKA
ncbi:MAG TPA: AAA family ATPase, partial [Flavobacteriales bacterium]|nr:AAA family ATPase [Flavobacteriales bacterium]